jgi:hypothetical protein
MGSGIFNYFINVHDRIPKVSSKAKFESLN